MRSCRALESGPSTEQTKAGSADGSGARAIGSNRAICISCQNTEIDQYLQAPDRFHGRTELYCLLRCRSCSLVWLENPPSPSEMERHYGPDYDRAVANAGKDPTRWRARCGL